MTANSASQLQTHYVKNLDAPPTPDGIHRLRAEAQEHAEAVAAALPRGSDTYLVVSPRGTCVLLDDFVKRRSWERDIISETVATELQST